MQCPTVHMPLSPETVVTNFRSALSEQGLRAALRYLNEQSSHRFTAVFRFEGETLRNLYLIDRDDPGVERCPDLPVLESYCVYVRELQKTFTVDDADRDDRVAAHPKRESVKSYCGIPLMDDEEKLFGTICHFDYAALPVLREEVWILEDVAPLVVRAVQASEWKPMPDAWPSTSGARA